MQSLITNFNLAFNRHDIDAMMEMMTEDCVFENTYPPPDGTRLNGKVLVKAFWISFFQSSPYAQIEIEEIFKSQDRVIQRWVYHWQETSGVKGHVRGVDLFTIRDGLIQEKLSYVKG
ncbi:MAG: nuclear transport factor 2 family protein [Anaerolineaceae bacterium]